MRFLQALIFLFTITTLANCAFRKNIKTPFKDLSNSPVIADGGNDPTNGTKYCSPDYNGVFNQGPVQSEVSIDASGVAHAVGGGCVLRPIREAWATTQNQLAMKFSDVPNVQSERIANPAPNFTHLYRVNYLRDENIAWLFAWYHGFDRGTFEAPERINIRFQKIDGTPFIYTWNGGIVLTKVNSLVTSVAILNNFKAAGQDKRQLQQDALDAVSDWLEHIRHGKPDWESLNAGFRDNPARPDDPPPGYRRPLSVFCVKDQTGSYPINYETSSLTEDGVSKINVRTCLNIDTPAAINVLMDPTGPLRFQNATSARVLSSSEEGLTKTIVKKVAYEGQGSAGPIKWTMTWRYKREGANKMAIAYHMDPETSDFPYWDGHIDVVSVEPGVSAISIENDLLLDTVAKSPQTNMDMSYWFLNSIVPANIAPHPGKDLE